MENKNKIIVPVIVLLVFGGLIWYARPDGNAKEQPSTVLTGASVSTLEVSEKFYDFGVISMKNGNVSKIFKVTNSGTENVNLANVSTSCMCTAAYIIKNDGSKIGPFGMPGHGGTGGMPGHGNGKAGEIIAAGESIDIEVVYDPNAHGPAGVGIVDRFIYLEDENGNKLELEIKANVTP